MREASVVSLGPAQKHVTKSVFEFSCLTLLQTEPMDPTKSNLKRSKTMSFVEELASRKSTRRAKSTSTKDHPKHGEVVDEITLDDLWEVKIGNTLHGFLEAPDGGLFACTLERLPRDWTIEDSDDEAAETARCGTEHEDPNDTGTPIESGDCLVQTGPIGRGDVGCRPCAMAPSSTAQSSASIEIPDTLEDKPESFAYMLHSTMHVSSGEDSGDDGTQTMPSFSGTPRAGS